MFEHAYSTICDQVSDTSRVSEEQNDHAFRLLQEKFLYPEKIHKGSTIEDTVASAQDANTYLISPNNRTHSGRFESAHTYDCGVSIGIRGNGIVVTDISPTRKQQSNALERGNILHAINGNPLTGPIHTMGDLAAVELAMTGKADSLLRLAIQTVRSKGEMCFLRTEQYRAANLGVHERPDVPVLRIRRFMSNLSHDIEDCLSPILHRRIRGLIIDLRGNYGGRLPACLDAAGLFLGKENICFSWEREGKKSHWSTVDAQFPDVPISLIIDRMTASAAEIFTAALQYHRGSAVIGKKSFGKGTMQRQYPIPGMDRELKITTGTWSTPGHASVQGIGIQPDYPADTSLSRHSEEVDEATALATRITLADAACRT